MMVISTINLLIIIVGRYFGSPWYTFLDTHWKLLLQYRLWVYPQRKYPFLLRLVLFNKNNSNEDFKFVNIHLKALYVNRYFCDCREFSLLGLALIAVGTGGIKPCVSAFGGDQFKLPEQERQLQTFFSVFYFAINAGSLISTALTPILRYLESIFIVYCNMHNFSKTQIIVYMI